jgi:hypothetical protein
MHWRLPILSTSFRLDGMSCGELPTAGTLT